MNFSMDCIDKDLHSEQVVITVKVPDTITEVAIIKMIPKSEIRRLGVDMNKAGGILLDTLKLYEKSTKLDIDSYKRILDVFEPFIAKSRTYVEIAQAMEVNRF